MDINKAIFILKEKIQQDIAEINLPVSVIKLILKDLITDIQKVENEYLKKLAQEEQEISQKNTEDKE